MGMPNGQWRRRGDARGEGDSEAVYLVCESVVSLSIVEPHTGERPRKPDKPDPR